MTKREEQLRQQIGRSLADIVGLTLPPEGIDALTALLHAAILEGGDATFLDRYQGAVEYLELSGGTTQEIAMSLRVLPDIYLY